MGNGRKGGNANIRHHGAFWGKKGGGKGLLQPLYIPIGEASDECNTITALDEILMKSSTCSGPIPACD